MINENYGNETGKLGNKFNFRNVNYKILNYKYSSIDFNNLKSKTILQLQIADRITGNYIRNIVTSYPMHMVYLKYFVLKMNIELLNNLVICRF